MYGTPDSSGCSGVVCLGCNITQEPGSGSDKYDNPGKDVGAVDIKPTTPGGGGGMSKDDFHREEFDGSTSLAPS